MTQSTEMVIVTMLKVVLEKIGFMVKMVMIRFMVVKDAIL